MENKQYEQAEIVNDSLPHTAQGAAQEDFNQVLKGMRRALTWRLGVAIFMAIAFVVVLMSLLVSLVIYLIPVLLVALLCTLVIMAVMALLQRCKS